MTQVNEKLTRKQAEERRARERREVLRRLRTGESSPEEKVDLYVRGEFFFPDVVEVRASREVAEADPRINNTGLVELDGRLWYVDPGFRDSLKRVKATEQRKRQKTAQGARVNTKNMRP